MLDSPAAAPVPGLLAGVAGGPCPVAFPQGGAAADMAAGLRQPGGAACPDPSAAGTARARLWTSRWPVPALRGALGPLLGG